MNDTKLQGNIESKGEKGWWVVQFADGNRNVRVRTKGLKLMSSLDI